MDNLPKKIKYPKENIKIASSREVANIFNKKHHHIVRDIEMIEAPAKFKESNYIETKYTDKHNRPRKEYSIHRDGFILLILGFTGKEAIPHKVAFINEIQKAITPKVKLIKFNPNQLQLNF
jgi:Rha family phage regulatory protein